MLCVQMCCAVGPACLAVIYSSESRLCHALPRQYNGSSFQNSTASFVANRDPGTPPDVLLPSDVLSPRAANTTWVCSDVFENAAAKFASLGVKAYVRHSHTSDEGTWCVVNRSTWRPHRCASPVKEYLLCITAHQGAFRGTWLRGCLCRASVPHTGGHPRRVPKRAIIRWCR